MSISARIAEQIGPDIERADLRDTLNKAEPLRLEDRTGRSGRRYLHLVYGLIECPVVPKTNYALVRRAADGSETILRVGRASHDAPTLNLAQIRHEGALLGANEVHLYILARTEAERILVEFDLAAGLLGDAEVAAAEETRH